MASPRQTATYLRNKFREIGLRPNARHGQSFLIDLNLIDFLFRAADVQPTDVVLEVGTGIGSLTAKLSEKAAHVVTIEIDQQLSLLAQEELDAATNITFLQQDALRNKNNLHPNVIQAVQEALQVDANRGLKLVANLPYNVATPIISNLLLSEIVPDSMTVTIQKELGQRIVAVPSTKDYGSLSVWIQSLCFASILRELPPSVFWPRPKVTSCIVQMISDSQKRAAIPDLQFFHAFTRKLFLHRRKFLRSSLVGAYKSELNKQQIDEILSAMQLGPDARAEQLDLVQIAHLRDLLHAKLLHSTPS